MDMLRNCSRMFLQRCTFSGKDASMYKLVKTVDIIHVYIYIYIFFFFFFFFNAMVKKSPTSLAANIKGNLTYKTRDMLTRQLEK